MFAVFSMQPPWSVFVMVLNENIVLVHSMVALWWYHLLSSLYRGMNAAKNTSDNGYKMWKEKRKTGTKPHFFW